MDWEIIGGIAGIVSLVLVIFAGGRYIGKLDELVKRHTLCPIIEVDKKLGMLEARFDMFMTMLERHAPKELVSPHSPHRDDLLQKMSNHGLKEEEAQELLTDMEANLDEFKGNDKFMAAILVIVRLKDLLTRWS